MRLGVVLVFLLVNIGCDMLVPKDNTNATKTTTANSILSFKPDSPESLGENTIYMSYNIAKSNADTLAIDIKANAVSNLFGIAFEINFDPRILTYEETENGDLLGGKDDAHYQAGLEDGSNNTLLIGVTRKNGDIAGVVGSGNIATLKFKRKGSKGSNHLTFKSNEARDNKNKKISVIWKEGTAEITG